MPLTVEQAVAAGEIAAKIQARAQKLDQLQGMLRDGWIISQFAAVDPATNGDAGLLLDRLDVATSQQCLAFAIQIYQAQIEALNAELAEIQP